MLQVSMEACITSFHVLGPIVSMRKTNDIFLRALPQNPLDCAHQKRAKRFCYFLRPHSQRNLPTQSAPRYPQWIAHSLYAHEPREEPICGCSLPSANADHSLVVLLPKVPTGTFGPTAYSEGLFRGVSLLAEIEAQTHFVGYNKSRWIYENLFKT